MIAMDGHQPQPSSETLASENGWESEDYGEEGGEKGPHPLAQAGTGSFPGGFIGKHRLQAAITNLNNQISILQVNSTHFFVSIWWSILFCSIYMHNFFLFILILLEEEFDKWTMMSRKNWKKLKQLVNPPPFARSKQSQHIRLWYYYSFLWFFKP